MTTENDWLSAMTGAYAAMSGGYFLQKWINICNASFLPSEVGTNYGSVDV